MAAINPDLTIDVKGLECPRPVLKTKQTLQQMPAGRILEVIATDLTTKSTIPSFLKHSGDELMNVSENAGEIRFYIKKK